MLFAVVGRFRERNGRSPAGRCRLVPIGADSCPFVVEWNLPSPRLRHELASGLCGHLPQLTTFFFRSRNVRNSTNGNPRSLRAPVLRFGLK